MAQARQTGARIPRTAAARRAIKQVDTMTTNGNIAENKQPLSIATSAVETAKETPDVSTVPASTILQSKPSLPSLAYGEDVTAEEDSLVDHEDGRDIRDYGKVLSIKPDLKGIPVISF